MRNASDLRDLALGGLLHDIGKSELPRELIVKPGAYTDAVEVQGFFTVSLEDLRSTSEGVLPGLFG